MRVYYEDTRMFKIDPRYNTRNNIGKEETKR